MVRDEAMTMRFVAFFAFVLACACASSALAERVLLVEKESLYNNIYIYSEPPYVSLTFGHNGRLYTESTYNTKDERDLPVVYTRYMTAGLIYAKDVKSILEIGSGGGRTAWYLHRYLPDVPVTSVELDPVVAELAQKHFGIKNEKNFRVAIRDGRLFLRESNKRYDMILIDAYRGPFVPFHLLTREFYEAVKAHLADGGVLVQNVEPSTMLFDSATKTIQSVFPNVEFYLAQGNVVTIAYGGTKQAATEVESAATERQAKYKLRYDLTKMLSQRRELSADTISADAKILTDDFAPVEALKAIEKHNRKWPNQ
jgi:spermidine synthase